MFGTKFKKNDVLLFYTPLFSISMQEVVKGKIDDNRERPKNYAG